MSEVHPNWQILNEKGVTAKAHVNSGSLDLGSLDKETAIKIGHAFTQKLDELSNFRRYTYYSLEQAQAEAEQRIKDNQIVIFGEMRPADRNCAVRIEGDSSGSYWLHADIRNDFEDRPELDGGKQLQRKFIETIESMDL